jgi:hypothetical protein
MPPVYHWLIQSTTPMEDMTLEFPNRTTGTCIKLHGWLDRVMGSDLTTTHQRGACARAQAQAVGSRRTGFDGGCLAPRERQLSTAYPKQLSRACSVSDLGLDPQPVRVDTV